VSRCVGSAPVHLRCVNVHLMLRVSEDRQHVSRTRHEHLCDVVQVHAMAPAASGVLACHSTPEHEMQWEVGTRRRRLEQVSAGDNRFDSVCRHFDDTIQTPAPNRSLAVIARNAFRCQRRPQQSTGNRQTAVEGGVSHLMIIMKKIGASVINKWSSSSYPVTCPPRGLMRMSGPKSLVELSSVSPSRPMYSRTQLIRTRYV